MIESVQDYAIFMLDPEGSVATWNLGAERIKGYTAVGNYRSSISRSFYSSEDVADGKPRASSKLRSARVALKTKAGASAKTDRNSGRMSIITALYDSQRQLRGFAKITRDMTDKRQVEQLQVADKQKNEFLAMLAHELRNPLAPIRNGVELLKMSRTAEPEIQETTRMMERQVRASCATG